MQEPERKDVDKWQLNTIDELTPEQAAKFSYMQPQPDEITPKDLRTAHRIYREFLKSTSRTFMSYLQERINSIHKDELSERTRISNARLQQAMNIIKPKQ